MGGICVPIGCRSGCSFTVVIDSGCRAATVIGLAKVGPVAAAQNDGSIGRNSVAEDFARVACRDLACLGMDAAIAAAIALAHS